MRAWDNLLKAIEIKGIDINNFFVEYSYKSINNLRHVSTLTSTLKAVCHELNVDPYFILRYRGPLDNLIYLPDEKIEKDTLRIEGKTYLKDPAKNSYCFIDYWHPFVQNLRSIIDFDSVLNMIQNDNWVYQLGKYEIIKKYRRNLKKSNMVINGVTVAYSLEFYLYIPFLLYGNFYATNPLKLYIETEVIIEDADLCSLVIRHTIYRENGELLGSVVGEKWSKLLPYDEYINLIDVQYKIECILESKAYVLGDKADNVISKKKHKKKIAGSMQGYTESTCADTVKNDNPQSIFELAQAYAYGIGIGINSNKAYYYFEKIVECNAQAKTEYAIRGLINEKITEECAGNYLQEARRDGDLLAIYLFESSEFDDFYYFNENLCSPDIITYDVFRFYIENSDIKKAFIWLNYAIKLGSNDAKYIYGRWLLYHGNSYEKRKGFEYLEQVERPGVSYMIAMAYYYGRYVKKDYEKAYEYLLNEIESPKALYQLSLMNAYGLGCKKNLKYAIKYMEKYVNYYRDRCYYNNDYVNNIKRKSIPYLAEWYYDELIYHDDLKSLEKLHILADNYYEEYARKYLRIYYCDEKNLYQDDIIGERYDY